MRKFRGIVLILVFILLLGGMSVYAEPNGEPIETVVHDLEYKEWHTESSLGVSEEGKQDKLEGLYEGETLLYGKDSPEMEGLLKKIKESVKEDSINGLDKIKDTVPTRDNIELQRWGLFLFKYADKEITEYPNGDITFTLGEDTYNIKPTKSAKTWVKDVVLPIIYETIFEGNKNYPAAMYKLDIDTGIKLVDLEIDLDKNKNYVELYKVYPLSGRGTEKPENFIVYNTGTYYGLTLHSDYVRVLKGYHGELDYMFSVKSDIPSCVEILAYITLPKNLEGLTMADKELKDMSIYEGLAVNLSNKKLVDTNNLTTDAIDIKYKDFSLNEEELILLSLSDSIVIVQPKFVEYFLKWGYDLNTAHYVDFTDFFTSGSPEITLTHLFDGTTVKGNIKDYVNESGLVDVTLEKRYPFAVYTTSDGTPYGRIIKRLYSSEGTALMSKEEIKKVTKEMESELKAKGRGADFKVYMKGAGQSSISVKIFSIVIILIVASAIGVFVVSKSNKKQKNNDSLLFDPEDEE